MLSKLIYKTMLTSYNILVCEQASSEVGKKFGERSEWESERSLVTQPEACSQAMFTSVI